MSAPLSHVSATKKWTVEIEVVNQADLALARRGAAAGGTIRRVTIPAVVSLGTTTLVLPEAVVAELGLRVDHSVILRYPDGRTVRGWKYGPVRVTLLGRDCTISPVVERGRTNATVGFIVLNELDLIVDEQNGVLPRDPTGPVYEI